MNWRENKLPFLVGIIRKKPKLARLQVHKRDTTPLIIIPRGPGKSRIHHARETQHRKKKEPPLLPRSQQYALDAIDASKAKRAMEKVKLSEHGRVLFV